MAEIKFKDLTADSLFDFCAVLDAVGLEQIVSAFDKREIAALQHTGQDQNGIGVAIAMKIVGVLVKNVAKARVEICAFLASCTQWDNGSAVTQEDLRGMKLTPFVRLVKDFAQRDELTDFFAEVGALLGMVQDDSSTSSGSDTPTPSGR